MGKEIKFKDTIMGKITKGAIISWGENDENGNWFKPTEQQAEEMLTEGGLQLGKKTIDYSSSDKATNGKTYGSEVAAINGLVELMTNSQEISSEEKTAITEQIKSEIYTEAHLSPEIEKKAKETIEGKGTEKSIFEVLGTIHDNWVKTNPNNFLEPDRNRERQFVPLTLLDWKEVQSDLLFLKPILEGAGITVDEEQLKKEFEVRQQEYMIDNKIFSHEDLVKHLSKGSKAYPALEGLETVNGGNIDGLLKNPETLERMATQIESRVAIKSREELATDLIKSDTKSLDEVLWIQTVERYDSNFDEKKLPNMNNPISKREIMLSKLIGKPYPTHVMSGIVDYKHDRYTNEIREPRDSEWDAVDLYAKAMERRQDEAANIIDLVLDKPYELDFGYDENGKIPGSIKVSTRDLLATGIGTERMESKAKVTSKDIAEADAKKELTATEVGGNKGLINKLKELFKGKGEK